MTSFMELIRLESFHATLQYSIKQRFLSSIDELSYSPYKTPMFLAKTSGSFNYLPNLLHSLQRS